MRWWRKRSATRKARSISAPSKIQPAQARDRAPRLFDGDSALFKQVALGAAVYGEYGVGQSTRWVYARTGAAIRAADTSQAWIERTAAGMDPSRVDLHHVDLGPVGDWGRPTSYARRDRFDDYFEYIWQGERLPDAVLIDGRFRVACFLTSLLRSAPGTKLVFDDYMDRPYYHVVEEILARQEVCGRQALFVTDEAVNRADAQALLEKFRYVMD